MVMVAMMMVAFTGCGTVDYTGTYTIDGMWGYDAYGEYNEITSQAESFSIAYVEGVNEVTITEDKVIFANGWSASYTLDDSNKDCYLISYINATGEHYITFYPADNTIELECETFDIWYNKCEK